MAIDTEAIKEHVRGILVALGDDPEREGLKETPERVAKMYEEVFEGMNYTNHEIAQMFDKTFDQDLELSGKSDVPADRESQKHRLCTVTGICADHGCDLQGKRNAGGLSETGSKQHYRR